MLESSDPQSVEKVSTVYSSSKNYTRIKSSGIKSNSIQPTTISFTTTLDLKEKIADKSLIKQEESTSDHFVGSSEEILSLPLNPEKVIKCHVCFKEFKFLSQLKPHMHLHTGERAFECPECSQTFAYKQNLTEHMFKHTGTKMECELCPKKIIPRLYKSHLKKCHVLQETYKCPDCGLGFFTPYLYREHKCKFSEEATATTCHICNKEFAENKNLKRHLLLHTSSKPFECEICHKTFARKDSLILHNRTHTKEKPYKCPICPKRFSQSSSLREHIRTHEGVKGYNCRFCGCKYARKSHLVRHEKHHQYKDHIELDAEKFLSGSSEDIQKDPSTNGTLQETLEMNSGGNSKKGTKDGVVASMQASAENSESLVIEINPCDFLMEEADDGCTSDNAES